jgi:hypothetical protein
VEHLDDRRQTPSMSAHSMSLTAGSLPVTRQSGRVATNRKHDSRTIYWGRLLLAATAVVSAAGFQMGFIWWLGVMTCIGFAAAMLGLVRPSLGLFGISLLCTLDAIMRHFLLDAGIQYLRFNTLNYWLLIVIIGHQGLIRRFRDPQSRLILGFIALLAFEMVFSERVARGAQHILGIVSMFGILVYFVRAAAHDRAWYWQGVISGSTSAFGGLLYNLQHSSIPGLNHNVYALFPETAIFSLCLAYGFADDKREEFVIIALTAVSVVWVFLSGSRGGLLMCAAALLFLIISMRGVGKKLLYVAGAVAVGILVAGWFGDLKTQSMVRLEKLWSADETADARTSGRTSLALGGWHIFMDNPLGVGTGESELAWAKLGFVRGVSDLKAGEEFSLHSGWIKILAENGLPGALFFAAVVGSFAVVGWKTGDRFLRGFGIAVTATLAIAFLSTEFQGKALWFLAAGAMTLLNRDHMLAALNGGRRRSVWWARPALPPQALRPKAVGTVEPIPIRTVARPRPIV